MSSFVRTYPYWLPACLCVLLLPCLFLSCGGGRPSSSAPREASDLPLVEQIAADEDFAEIVALDNRLVAGMENGSIVVPPAAAASLVSTDGITSEAALEKAESDQFVGFAEFKKLSLARNERLMPFYARFPELRAMPPLETSALLREATLLLERSQHR